MKRHELEIVDPDLWQEVLRVGTWGTLSLTDADGWPYSVPMNYFWANDRVVVHGSSSGKRAECLKHSLRAQFTVVREFSMIPSDIFGSELACGATQFFQSVMLWGSVRSLSDAEEKAARLQSLMERLQPAGGHAPIHAENPSYVAALRGTGVWELIPEQVSAKFKFGQNLSTEKATALADFLEKRGDPGDAASASWIRRLRS